MEEIEAALASRCALFAVIGTSGQVYPAAGFADLARRHGARTIELNLEPTDLSRHVDEARHGPATPPRAGLGRRGARGRTGAGQVPLATGRRRDHPATLRPLIRVRKPGVAGMLSEAACNRMCDGGPTKDQDAGTGEGERGGAGRDAVRPGRARHLPQPRQRLLRAAGQGPRPARPGHRGRARGQHQRRRVHQRRRRLGQRPRARPAVQGGQRHRHPADHAGGHREVSRHPA